MTDVLAEVASIIDTRTQALSAADSGLELCAHEMLQSCFAARGFAGAVFCEPEIEQALIAAICGAYMTGALAGATDPAWARRLDAAFGREGVGKSNAESLIARVTL